MLRQEEIALVIDAQREIFMEQDSGFIRNALTQIPVVDSFATIITGLRRCGKSTLLLQLLRKDYHDAIYLNFDDIRLSVFESDDFTRLHREIVKRGIKIIFFDEIQSVKSWETYVNQLLREGYKVFITGSNASMLSKELGTSLTGRHLSMELFPFSYNEYIHFKGLNKGENSILAYLRDGGIPEYLKSEAPIVLNGLVDDILIRDIAVRHSIRDIMSLRQLTAFLITNIGNMISANKLIGMFEIKSPSTFLEYFSFLKDAYLLEFVPIFSHSLKIQARNPKKIYIVDTGIYTANSISTSENMGKRLENLIFIHLRHKYKQIFYYKGQRECDFVTMENNRVNNAIQVYLTVNDENFVREYEGLLEVMKNFKLKEGYIVTLNQTDSFKKDDMLIRMMPVYEFLV